jgi:hypothetical protein
VNVRPQGRADQAADGQQGIVGGRQGRRRGRVEHRRQGAQRPGHAGPVVGRSGVKPQTPGLLLKGAVARDSVQDDGVEVVDAGPRPVLGEPAGGVLAGYVAVAHGRQPGACCHRKVHGAVDGPQVGAAKDLGGAAHVLDPHQSARRSGTGARLQAARGPYRQGDEGLGRQGFAQALRHVLDPALHQPAYGRPVRRVRRQLAQAAAGQPSQVRARPGDGEESDTGRPTDAKQRSAGDHAEQVPARAASPVGRRLLGEHVHLRGADEPHALGVVQRERPVAAEFGVLPFRVE